MPFVVYTNDSGSDIAATIYGVSLMVSAQEEHQVRFEALSTITFSMSGRAQVRSGGPKGRKLDALVMWH